MDEQWHKTEMREVLINIRDKEWGKTPLSLKEYQSPFPPPSEAVAESLACLHCKMHVPAGNKLWVGKPEIQLPALRGLLCAHGQGNQLISALLSLTIN